MATGVPREHTLGLVDLKRGNPLPTSWLSRCDRDAFGRWFEWSFHSVVVDLSDKPLLREEI